MAKTAPFEAHPDRYDDWFDRHAAAYQSERRALRAAMPPDGEGLEVGVGTGRFAVPLGITKGVDPSPAMRSRARTRGLDVKNGVAEALPYPDARFDVVLLTTTLCYLDDPETALREVWRVLRPGGACIIGFLDGAGPLARQYEGSRAKSEFYEPAQFYTADDVRHVLETTGFEDVQAWQTLVSDPETMTEPDSVWTGTGEGGFGVLRGTKPTAAPGEEDNGHRNAAA